MVYDSNMVFFCVLVEIIGHLNLLANHSWFKEVS